MHRIQGALVAAGRLDLAEALTPVVGKKWMQKVSKSIEKKGSEGSLRKHFNLKEGQTLTKERVDAEIRKLQSKYKGKDKKYSDKDLKLLRQLNFAKNALRAKK